MIVFVLLVLIAVIGGGVAVGNVMQTQKRRRLMGSSDAPKALPAGAPAKPPVERSLSDLRVGDVLVIDGKDFLVEGVIGYDEDGHRWMGARVVDGKDVRWAIVGVERTGAQPVRLLTQDTDNPVSGFPPEVLVIGELRYKLDKRGTATCKMTGDLGALTPANKDAVDRCRWWLYGAAGDDTLVLEQWSGEYRVLRGKKVASDTIDLIPGS